MPDVLTLTDTLFIGKGGHQAAYIHPSDPSKCIKIAFDLNDGDVKKELRYRKICADKLAKSKLVTKYYGRIDTNLGSGLVFERVVDFDGTPSLDLKDYLPITPIDTARLDSIRKLLLEFKDEFISEGIAIVDTDITNFMVQRISPDKIQMRIVDNIGTPVLIPIVYYSEIIARIKARRVWNRIANRLSRHYPHIVDENFLSQLRA